jgi:NADH-quinone oxidoreductase subunit A
VNGISINALAAGVLILASLGMGIGMIVFSHWLGRHKSNPRKIAPYESGMPLLDFLLFDVEMAFLYPFALIRGFAKPFMFVELGVFFLMMTATYLYLLKEHAFRWEN